MSATHINRLIYVVGGLIFIIGLADSFGLTVKDGHVTQSVPLSTKVKSEAVINQAAIPNTTEVAVVRVRTNLDGPSSADNAWLLVARLPGLFIICGLALLGLKFVVNVARQRIFEMSSIWALRVAALLLFVAPFVKVATSHALHRVIDSSPVGHLPTYTTFSPGPLVAGLALVLLAEAFAVGRRAQKDTEGLV
jgi:hypothetical protein